MKSYLNYIYKYLKKYINLENVHRLDCQMLEKYNLIIMRYGVTGGIICGSRSYSVSRLLLVFVLVLVLRLRMIYGGGVGIFLSFLCARLNHIFCLFLRHYEAIILMKKIHYEGAIVLLHENQSFNKFNFPIKILDYRDHSLNM